ncbi:MAG: peptidoglycan-binding domain-containing protein, partial [Patescibacteria group bacterium]
VVKDLSPVSLNSALKSQSANVLSALDNANTSCVEFNMILSKGMNNSQVKCLQKLLNAKGFAVAGTVEGNETTYFGFATLTALKAFQVSNNLTTDGVFGPNTRVALQK